MTIKLVAASAAFLGVVACGQGGDAPTTGGAAPDAAANSAPATATVGAGGMPRQRPGLWRVTVNMPVIGPQSMEQCITPEEASRGMDINASDSGQCGTPNVTRDGNGWNVTATCGEGAGRSEVRTRISGDPQSRYNVTTSVAGPDGQPMEIRADAQYVGPCPA